MAKWMIVLAMVLWCGAASAADLPKYAPPPAWVKTLKIPDPPPGSDGAAIQLLLLDSQVRLSPNLDEFYFESAFRIASPQGLSSAASLPLSWSPDTETLVIHNISIIRDGKVIDLTDGGKKVSILRREGSLELAMLDGRLTATLQPEGLQVGDVVDMRGTFERRDPIRRGHSEVLSRTVHDGNVGRFHTRRIWSDANPMLWRATEGLPKPTILHEAGNTELIIDQLNAIGPKPPKNAPARFQNVGTLEVTQFQTWAEVSGLMAPLYVKAANIASGSPLRAEVDKIRRLSNDPKVRTEAALSLVQDQIHYVALSMNLGGYVPADADATWTRRFGDCKGKSVLLLAILNELNIDAEAVLVDTQTGETLGESLPMLRVFDHVFVRVNLKGKTYWIDGTRSHDVNLDDIPIPSFGWVLPIRATGAKLERLQPSRFRVPAFESLKRIDASGGYDIPAKVHAEYVYRGDLAITWQAALANLGKAESQRYLREYWRGQLSWVEPKTVEFDFDPTQRLARMTVDGQGKVDWDTNGNVRDYSIGDSSLGQKTSFQREPGPYADAPISVDFPDFDKWTVVITLPKNGTGFRLLHADDVEKTVGARRYYRRSRLDGGVVTMTAEEESLASEFPWSDAVQVAADLRELYSNDVVVRGPDPHAKTTQPDEDVAEVPKNAGGYSLRGAAFLNHNDYVRAIEDFGAAARLEPNEAKHFYNRGVAYVYHGDETSALADFDKAIRMSPKVSLAYVARAELLLRRGESPKAWRDFDLALKLAPRDAGILRRRVAAAETAGRYDIAVGDLTTLLETVEDTPDRARLLNKRCWARAEWGKELQNALTDCNAALELLPDSAPVLDSRGFVRLRSGDFVGAIADYDSALRLAPRQAESLFGRGLAKQRTGRVSESQADWAAALAVDPKVEQMFSRYGLKRP